MGEHSPWELGDGPIAGTCKRSVIVMRWATVSGQVSHGKGLGMLRGVGADEHHWQNLHGIKEKDI